MYQFKLIHPNVSLLKIVAPVFDLLFCFQDHLSDVNDNPVSSDVDLLK